MSDSDSAMSRIGYRLSTLRTGSGSGQTQIVRRATAQLRCRRKAGRPCRDGGTRSQRLRLVTGDACPHDAGVGVRVVMMGVNRFARCMICEGGRVDPALTLLVRWRPVIPLLVISLAASCAAGPGYGEAPRLRLRASTPAMRAVIDEGLRRSVTVRRLADQIERSDLIVYVERGPLPAAIDAQTSFVVASGAHRFVRVTLRIGVTDHVPLLAHELQHVVEIASAPQVRDASGLRRLYEEIGISMGPSTFETTEAREAERASRRELRASR